MNPDITTTLWVALGGGLGGVARYSIGTAIARLAGNKALWGTLAVNILGSFLLGYLGSPFLSDGSSLIVLILSLVQFWKMKSGHLVKLTRKTALR
jgi:fluoride ion exporter CrcB/FEX